MQLMMGVIHKQKNKQERHKGTRQAKQEETRCKEIDGEKFSGIPANKCLIQQLHNKELCSRVDNRLGSVTCT
jgi:hypothetical protein